MTKSRQGLDGRARSGNSLDTAQIAVLLVSPNFLASDFITDVELPYIFDDAEKELVAITWISFSASAYKQTAIARYQCVNNPRRPLNTLSDANTRHGHLRLRALGFRP